jgi:hypothetical protein
MRQLLRGESATFQKRGALMTWSRLLFFLLIALSLASTPTVTHAGQPTTPSGIDVIVGDATGHPSGTVTLPVLFVPAADNGAQGGPDEISVIQFTIKFAGLELDESDANNDSIPDAVVFNPDGNLILAASFTPVITSQPSQLDVLVSNARRDAALPSVTLIALTLRIPTQSVVGNISVALSDVNAKDKLSVDQPIDEAVPGVITVIAAPASETPTATATPTKPTATPTATFTRRPPTPRPTRTPAPPTPGEHTPPAGIDLSVHGQNGGCAIAGASGGRGFALMFGALLAAVRRRREAHSRTECAITLRASAAPINSPLAIDSRTDAK